MQERIQYYFVTLAFTLLALSIQTAGFSGSNFSQASELIGWVSLLLSGMFGLSRLNSIPANYKISIHQQSHQSNIIAASKLIQNGNKTIFLEKTNEIVDAGDFLRQQEEALTSFNNEEECLLKKQKLFMRIHRIALMLGLILLVVARGIDPACSLVV